jgi:hypothetical protein
MSKVMPMSNFELKNKKLTKKMVKEMIEVCGLMYNFDYKEALIRLNLEKEKVKKEKKVQLLLPFDGRKREGCCNGIVKNNGLYTQCVKAVDSVDGYCKTCESQPYGNIEQRLKSGLYDYKDPKGKSPKRYLEVLKKKNISKEEMLEKCKKAEIEIVEEHLEEVSTKRGRPKSDKSNESGEKKSKGRPKKEKKVVEVSNEEDLFANLVMEAQKKEEVVEMPPKEVKEVKEPKEKKVKEPKEKKTKGRPKKETKEVEISKAEESEELVEELVEEVEEADVVTKIEYEGKQYYKSKKSGIIYNVEQDVVGIWNKETNKIDFEESEEEEYEE